ncbi:AAA family ATPase [Devosia sp. 1566]|uniref:AAA family ATPase n=1 Tax=Devosia sp. 1566 TaxID=2499144 RepID=UPI000FDBE131|nr:AAA family ATPase [Devosia sp. 1566]
MARQSRQTRLPAPFLKRLWRLPDWGTRSGYPFNLPWLQDPDWSLEFTTPITIIVGENGTGKSTLVEAIAAMSGYDEAGGGKGYMPVDHSAALDRSGALLTDVLRASWLPKVTNGWFFRAESFYSVARYLDAAAIDAGGAAPDYLSQSHGEGFVDFFESRMTRQGIYFLDEPESALSPQRQRELLRLLHRLGQNATAQIIMATHSPLLMALPGATLLEITRDGLAPVRLRDTRHFRLYRDFTADPKGWIAEVLEDL